MFYGAILLKQQQLWMHKDQGDSKIQNLSSAHHNRDQQKKLCVSLNLFLLVIKGSGASVVVPFRDERRGILELDSTVMPPSVQFSSNAPKSPHTLHQYYCNSLALGYLAAAEPHW